MSEKEFEPRLRKIGHRKSAGPKLFVRQVLDVAYKSGFKSLSERGMVVSVDATKVEDTNNVRTRLRIQSYLTFEKLAEAEGVTWLDKELVSRAPATIAEQDFGIEAKAALNRRRQCLIAQRLGQIDTQGMFELKPKLFEILRQREYQSAAQSLSRELGLSHHAPVEGEQISGTFTKTVNLASGKYAIVEKSHEFTLVPWRPEMEPMRGKAIAGTASAQGIQWEWRPRRGLGISVTSRLFSAFPIERICKWHDLSREQTEVSAVMRRRQDPKIKLTVYVSRTVAGQLDLACKDRTKNKSKLTETALKQLLSPQRDNEHESGMPRRLDKLSREVNLINRHQQIVIESFGLFIRHYLAMSPPLPQAEQQAAQALGQQRFQRFIEQLGRRLASTSTLVAEISDQLTRHGPTASTDAPPPNGASPTATGSSLKS